MIVGISAQLRGKELLKHEEILPRLEGFKHVNLYLGVQGLKYVKNNSGSFDHLRRKHGLNYSITLNLPVDMDLDMVCDQVNQVKRGLKTNKVSVNLLKSGVFTEQDGKQKIHRYELYSFNNVVNKVPSIAGKDWHLKLPEDYYSRNDFSIVELKKKCDEHETRLLADSSLLDGWRESHYKVMETTLPESSIVFAKHEDVKKNKGLFEKIVNNNRSHLVVVNSCDPEELEAFKDKLLEL